MGAGGQRILVVGSSSPWLEGVVDLLQLAGYDVTVSPDWETAERGIQDARPDLAILDLSDRVDSLQLPQEVTALAPAGDVPILLLNSTGDDRIWHLERVGNPSRGRVDLYAHSLFGPTALLEKVKGCLA
jgi:DNA-binding response OmpR family regulator